MGYGQKIKDWFTDEVDGEEEEFNQEPSKSVDTESKQSLFEAGKYQQTNERVQNISSDLNLFEPHSFAEASRISDYLKANKTVVVNMHRLQKEQSKRVIDFLSGVIYAIDGDIQTIGPRIFLCTPKSISVSGNITDGEETDL